MVFIVNDFYKLDIEYVYGWQQTNASATVHLKLLHNIIWEDSLAFIETMFSLTELESGQNEKCIVARYCMEQKSCSLSGFHIKNVTNIIFFQLPIYFEICWTC